jgi:hypothetical protein
LSCSSIILRASSVNTSVAYCPSRSHAVSIFLRKSWPLRMFPSGYCAVKHVLLSTVDPATNVVQIFFVTIFSPKLLLPLTFYENNRCIMHTKKINNKNKLRGLIRKRTIPTEPPSLVGEVSANFSG